MKTTFAHIIKEDFSLGLIYLPKPRCIKWFGAGFRDDTYEWIDRRPTIQETSTIIFSLDMKEVDLGYTGTEGFPLIEFDNLNE